MPVPPTSPFIRKHASTLWGLLILLITGLICAPVLAATPPELHVLIDVSGSMKQTDPQNLRRPALRLLGDLLPPSAQIGIWFFGNEISPMLKTARADPKVKERVRQTAKKIRSNEPFTDIPAALTAAAATWNDGTDRNILLLSDGMVDISPDKSINVRAQAALLQKLVPQLRAEHIRVHTIALSKDADSKLLSQIAADTGGIFVEADSADALQRAFLKIFEAAAPRDGLPLKDNKFLVDSAVKELTILAFRDNPEEQTKLKLPNGQIVDVQGSKSKTGWRWDDSGGRDLVTIENPPTGAWQIIGALDPDNRALIITDLKLRLTSLPTRIYPGERIDGALMLTNHDQPITKPALTQTIKATIDEQKGSELITSFKLNDQGADPDIIGGDGRFNYQLHLIDPAGIYSLVATASSPTFQRDWRQNFAMAPLPPVQLKIVSSEVEVPPAANADGTAGHPTQPGKKTLRQIQVTQDPTVLEPKTAKIIGQWQCERTHSEGQHSNKPQTNKIVAPIPIEWNLTRTTMMFPTPDETTADCVLNAVLKAKLTTHREIDLVLEPFKLAALPPTEAQPKQSEPVEQAQEGASGKINWMLIIVINVITLLLIGLGIWLWQQKVKHTHRQLLKEAQSV
ncbi:vWA domain-containing protein [Halothiobacillus sp. 15-55-196]|jgi:hypothetical protein|uniref:vWA domain-containing protein n=1 Tax=Halothiobacillus sp. 15-55-196 TaxID=1970382 RepID=UPI0025B817EE|nr:vWA domain-containing protein [Halothiobacillus sp. 15-55-196]